VGTTADLHVFVLFYDEPTLGEVLDLSANDSARQRQRGFQAHSVEKLTISSPTCATSRGVGGSLKCLLDHTG
jgi:hypothetical protein